MKAIFYTKYGPIDVLKYGDLPKPIPGRDELLVRVQAAALNPVDLEIRSGKASLLSGFRFPRIPGSDFAGVVESAGAGAIGFQPGDKVYGFAPTLKGGSYAEYLCIKSNQAAKMPEGIGMDEAASLPLAAQTALQALRDLGGLQKGQKVFIHGASGGVGTLAVQIARILGAEVHAGCSYRNIDLVKTLGAHAVMDYTVQDIRKLGAEYDIFFDIYGNMPLPKVWHQVRKTGMHISTIPNPANFWHAANPFSRRKTRVVIVQSRQADLELLADWVADGQLNPMVDKHFPLDAAREAQEYLATRRARGKVVLMLTSE